MRILKNHRNVLFSSLSMISLSPSEMLKDCNKIICFYHQGHTKVISRSEVHSVCAFGKYHFLKSLRDIVKIQNIFCTYILGYGHTPRRR